MGHPNAYAIDFQSNQFVQNRNSLILRSSLDFRLKMLSSKIDIGLCVQSQTRMCPL